MSTRVFYKTFLFGISCMALSCLTSCNEVSVDVTERLTESVIIQTVTTLKSDVPKDCEESLQATDTNYATDHSLSNFTRELPPSDFSEATDSESTTDSEHIHTYTSVVIDPTCTDDGYTVNTCSCGNSYRDSVRSALGHAYGAWIVTKNPTEFSEGAQMRVCSRCSEEETMIIDKITPVGCLGRGIDVYEVQRLALEYVETLENAVADSSLIGVDRGGYAGWTIRIFTLPYKTQEKLLDRVKEGLLVEYENYIQFQSVVKLHIWIDNDERYPGEYCLYILHQ